jgi:hypothetical protein
LCEVTTVTTKAVRGARPEAIWERQGGKAVEGIGLSVLIGGAATALIGAGVLQWLFPAGIAGYVLGAAILALSLPLGFFLRHAAKKLGEKGDAREYAATLETLLQLSAATPNEETGATTGGGVSVEEFARLGGVTEAHADRVLTKLAEAGDARLEVNGEGDLLYYPKQPKVRVATPVAAISHSARFLEEQANERTPEAEAEAEAPHVDVHLSGKGNTGS